MKPVIHLIVDSGSQQTALDAWLFIKSKYPQINLTVEHKEAKGNVADLLILDDAIPLYARPDLIDANTYAIPLNDNSYRGGSRKKGGKTKYQRN